MDDADDLFDEEETLWPRGRSTRKGARLPAYIAIHGAYHVLSQRMRLEALELGLAPSEAVVLATMHRDPGTTISVIRQGTGLRASTLDSLLDRLEARDLVRRTTPRSIRNEVVLQLTAAGRHVAESAYAAVREVDLELAGFMPRETLDAARTIFEASRALGVPGTASDY